MRSRHWASLVLIPTGSGDDQLLTCTAKHAWVPLGPQAAPLTQERRPHQALPTLTACGALLKSPVAGSTWWCGNAHLLLGRTEKHSPSPSGSSGLLAEQGGERLSTRTVPLGAQQCVEELMALPHSPLPKGRQRSYNPMIIESLELEGTFNGYLVQLL